MPQITREDVRVPADVMPETVELYIDNYMAATRGTGRLMLFACDQKIEHLNKDFHGEGIDPADGDPEHLFQIGDQGTIGVLAGQRGLIAQYARDYPNINYLVKMNSKTNLVKTAQQDPYSPQLYDLEAVLAMREAGVNIVGLGYTIYLGSEYEANMLAEAGELIAEAHAEGLLVVLWIYPRGEAVTDEKAADLIAGAAGVALCLGADFVKVNPPAAADGKSSAELLAVASRAAGRTGLVCAGGSKADAASSSQASTTRSTWVAPSATPRAATSTCARSMRPCASRRPSVPSRSAITMSRRPWTSSRARSTSRSSILAYISTPRGRIVRLPSFTHGGMRHRGSLSERHLFGMRSKVPDHERAKGACDRND